MHGGINRLFFFKVKLNQLSALLLVTLDKIIQWPRFRGSELNKRGIIYDF